MEITCQSIIEKVRNCSIKSPQSISSRCWPPGSLASAPRGGSSPNSISHAMLRTIMGSLARRVRRRGTSATPPVDRADEKTDPRTIIDAQPDAVVREVLTDRNPRFPEPPNGFYFPVITRLLDAALREAHARDQLPLPQLGGCQSLSVHCDFSGDHAGSRYRTWSFLVSSYRPREFEAEMGEIRVRHGLNKPAREIAYKDLRGGVERALPEYLAALDRYVPGLLFTLAVPTTERRLLAPDDGQVLDEALRIAGMSEWKRKVSYKALCVTQVCAYLVALLGHASQRVVWMLDNDEIVANSERGVRSAEVLASLVRAYAPNGPQVRGWAVPFADRSEMVFHDLLSATDLAAGTILEALARESGRAPSRKPHYDLMERWLGEQGRVLRKLTVVIRPDSSDGRISARLVRPGGLQHQPTDNAQRS